MSLAEPLSTPAAAHAHARAVALRSGSSFLLGMRILPRHRRDAMYAIYAFCREVDDIADGTSSVAHKLAGLDAAPVRAVLRVAP